MVTDLTPTLMWEVPVDEDDAISYFGNQISTLQEVPSFQIGMNNFSSIGFGVVETSVQILVL